MSSIKLSRNLSGGAKIVAAIASLHALRRAAKLPHGAVDFFEIRVDAFASNFELALRLVPTLRAPLIITVRHPAEGGSGALTVAQRRRLFSAFLPVAAYLDIELRSFQNLASTLSAARLRGVKIIASAHFFHATPAAKRLQHLIRSAHHLGADICKIASLAATPAALATLLGLLGKKQPLPLSVMGMGEFGKISRLLFAQAGSVLNYGYVLEPNASGQWEATLLKERLAELTAP